MTGLFVAAAPTPLVFEDFVPVDHIQPDEHGALNARAAARFHDCAGGVCKNASSAPAPRALDGVAPPTLTNTERLTASDLLVLQHLSHQRAGVLTAYNDPCI